MGGSPVGVSLTRLVQAVGQILLTERGVGHDVIDNVHQGLARTKVGNGDIAVPTGAVSLIVWCQVAQLWMEGQQAGGSCEAAWAVLGKRAGADGTGAAQDTHQQVR